VVKVSEVPDIKLERSVSGRGRIKKERYTVGSLPFPRGSASAIYNQHWRRVFKPSLIEWAAMSEDPFGTNVEMDEAVEGLWAEIFPSIASEVNGSQGRPAIIQIVCHIVHSDSY